MKVDNLESLEAYFDGELSPEESSQIESQIQAQPELRKQLEAFKHDSILIKQFPQVKLPIDLSASVLELAEKVQPCPFALADSPINSDISNKSVVFSQTHGESEPVSISREDDNISYDDDWKAPTITQRISRALLWPMLVLMIALGMYITNPSNDPVAIKTTPDESEFEVTSQKIDTLSDSESYAQTTNTNSQEIDAVQVKNNAASNSKPQITILCKIDAQKFTNEQWYMLLNSFGIETDKSKDPLEVKSWTVHSTSDDFKKMFVVLESAPGIVSAQTENADLFKTQSEKTSANITIRLVVDEL